MRRQSHDPARMRLWWTHLWKSPAYRRASADERRLMEIRFCVARALKRKRRHRRITQAALAKQLSIAQSSISRIERATTHASLTVAVRAFVALGCTDAEIAGYFDAGSDAGIRILRRRAQERAFPKPRSPAVPPPTHEQRFLRKRQNPRGL